MIKRRPFLSVIIAAGGSSTRMNGKNKLLLKIKDIPVLCLTVRAFEECEEVDEIVISAREDMLKDYAALVGEYGFRKVTKVVKGGETRLLSVYNAAISCSKKSRLHYGARRSAAFDR